MSYLSIFIFIHHLKLKWQFESIIPLLNLSVKRFHHCRNVYWQSDSISASSLLIRITDLSGPLSPDQIIARFVHSNFACSFFFHTEIHLWAHTVRMCCSYVSLPISSIGSCSICRLSIIVAFFCILKQYRLTVQKRRQVYILRICCFCISLLIITHDKLLLTCVHAKNWKAVLKLPCLTMIVVPLTCWVTFPFKGDSTTQFFE